jgi:fructose-1,6-bisphosphatase II
MDRKLLLEYVRVCEAAAIACSRLVGHGDKNAADQKAVTAMRRAFDRVPARGEIVIGEGEMDEAPMLYIGEKVGPKDDSLPEVDIAVDPLEGTTLTAKGMPGAICVLAVAEKGMLLHAPDIYMDKIAAGPEGKGVISLDKSPTENVQALADAKGKRVHDMNVVLLDRPRHEPIIKELRKLGARVSLISDGDVNPTVAVGLPDTGIDLYLGIGGAPEGVLGAAALRCLGGEYQGRLRFADQGERDRALEMGLSDPEALLQLEDIVKGQCLFAATGVTRGPLLAAAKVQGDRVRLKSIGLRSDSRTVRFFETWTHTDHLPVDE